MDALKSHLIFIGAPGSGKGTQAKLLERKFGYQHISTGDLLRFEIKRGSPLGARVKATLAEGNLVDDHTVLELLTQNTNVLESSYIFDGFPRNKFQAELLEEELLMGANHLALYFNLDSESLIERIVNRRTCLSCGAIYNLLTGPPAKEAVCDFCGGNIVQRKDDNEETVRNRIKVYDEACEDLLAFYEEKRLLRSLDAEKDQREVFAEISKLIS